MRARTGVKQTRRRGGWATAGFAYRRRLLRHVDVEDVLPDLGQDRPRLRREVPVCSLQIAGDSLLQAGERLRQESVFRGSTVVALGQARLRAELPESCPQFLWR
jgi:hypothetical protein